MNVIWLGCVFVITGTVLLRIAGRRSISQMTFGSVLVMLSLGTILAEPVARKSPVITLFVVLAMLVTLVVLEWLELQFNTIERLFSGKSVLIVRDGVLQEKNLRKLRITVDKLETRLRQKGIKHLADVKTATIEPNGELGYELKPELEPLTVGQFEQVMQSLVPDIVRLRNQSETTRGNIFEELESGPSSKSHSDYLQ